jgi:MoaA/NifB/PqqE/SkfB family radical SAM enzyme
MTSFSHEGLSLDIALTSSCPLRCRYCSVEKKPVRELEGRQWESVVTSFARLRRIDFVSLEGGEPFLRPDLQKILKACLEVAREVKIVSSGVVPFHSLPGDLLRDPRFFLELSLDGPRRVHDFLRDGSWERAWNFLQAGLERGIRMRLRSVISRHNLSIFEGWLEALDRALDPFGQEVGFSFDTILAPEFLACEGGKLPRLGIRSYPTRGLLPSPAEVGHLFRSLKDRSFGNLILIQTEPLRGCGAARGGFLSFDPEGIFSLCCEAPRGVGSISRVSAQECLSFLDNQILNRPCRGCPFFSSMQCNGCWTGQKCGMVKYWGAEHCRALLGSMTQDLPPSREGKEFKSSIKKGKPQSPQKISP